MILHNGKIYPSVSLAYTVHTKESYERILTLFNYIDYDKHKWKIRRDLKVMELLLGMQQGYTKRSCFLCELDSRDKKNHYVRKDRCQRHTFAPEKMNISHEPLVNPQDIYLPPLEMKARLMKIFVKTPDRGQAFAYLRNSFPKLSENTEKGGVFIGPQL